MKVLKWLVKTILKVKVAALTLVAIALVAAKVPELHNLYLRDYVGKNVVKILGKGGGGTGFYITTPKNKTYILTNNHICELADNADKLKVVHNNNEFFSKVAFRSKKTDLCLIESNDERNGVELADSMELGESANLLGHPGLRPLTLHKGEAIGYEKIDLLFGLDVPEDRCFGVTYFLKNYDTPESILLQAQGINSLCVVTVDSTSMNMISYPGASGSPVVNEHGELIGVLFAGNTQAITVSFLVPLEDVREFLSDK